MLRAVIFDVDGTLVNSVGAHVSSWVRAFHEHGIEIAERAVHEHAGNSGHRMVLDLLTGDERARLGERIRARAAALFDEYRAHVKPFPGVAELIRRVHDTGRRVALASNSGDDEIRAYAARMGVADVVDEVVGNGEVDHGKPWPQCFECALERLGVPAAQAIAVGDTPADVEAARRCGLAAIGLDSGGFGTDRLVAAGAVAVFHNAIALLEDFERSPLAAGKASR